MAAFRFGVDSFIWTEVFSEKDIWILPKAKELGFDVVDLAIAHPESFPLEKVLEAKRQTGLELVTTTTLGLDTNLISPDEAVRKNGINHMKRMVDINKAVSYTHLDVYKRQVLNAAARRERTISFQFSPDLDFDIAVARLLTEEPYKYAYYVHLSLIHI